MASLLSSGSFPIGHLAGIPVRLHITFPLAFAAALIAQSSLSWAGLGWVALIYGPILLVSVLIHELGHSLAARRMGSETHGILLWPLGGLAFIGHSSGPRADLLVALAGPLTHIPQFVVWFIALIPVSLSVYGSVQLPWTVPSPDEHFGLAVAVGACWLNVMLAAFNLCLPAYPLDGGRILADSLLLAGVGEVLAAKVTAGLAVVLGLVVMAWGAYSVSVLTIAVGAWMLYTTWGLVVAIRDGTVAQHPLFCYEEAAGTEGTKAGYSGWTQQDPA